MNCINIFENICGCYTRLNIEMNELHQFICEKLKIYLYGLIHSELVKIRLGKGKLYKKNYKEKSFHGFG